MKNVLITGSASGIGNAVKKIFLKNGYTVIGIDKKSQREEDNCINFKIDITNINDINYIKDYLNNNNIVLDGIINVAGIHDMISLVESDFSDINKIIEINLLGTMKINNTLYYNLSKKGRIIIVTSEVAGFDPMPFNGLYNVSKTALDCYAQALRQELNLLGQKVITVRPGAVLTPLSDKSLDSTEKLALNTVLYKKQAHKFLKLTKKFMGKAIDPDRVAMLIFKAFNKKYPKLCYKINHNFLLTLLNVLPKKLQCYIIRRILD